MFMHISSYQFKNSLGPVLFDFIPVHLKKEVTVRSVFDANKSPRNRIPK